MPLDIADLYERQSGTDFRDDAIFLLNVDESCDRYGEEVYMDFHSGRNPITLYKFGSREAAAEAPNGEYFEEGGIFSFGLILALMHTIFYLKSALKMRTAMVCWMMEKTWIKMVDWMYYSSIQNPVLDWKASNTAMSCRQLINFYDRQANRLFLKPLWPLEQQCTAVVLTKRSRKGNKSIDSIISLCESGFSDGCCFRC